MPTLTIENAPEGTIRELRELAERSHRTVSEVALDFLPTHTHETPRPVDGWLRDVLAKGSQGEDSTAWIRRDRDEVSRNRLSPEEALALCESISAMALKPILPDSTPFIRADRDAR